MEHAGDVLEQFEYMLTHIEDQHYLVQALVILVGFVLARKIFDVTVMIFLKRVAAKCEHSLFMQLFEESHKPILFFFIVAGLFFSIQVLHVPGVVYNYLTNFTRALGSFTLFWWLFNVLDTLIQLLERSELFSSADKRMSEDVRHFSVMVIRILLVVLGAISILEELGFNVTTFLGGVGLVGMAMALAAKDSLANLFGGILIMMDRTFKKGDWIQTPTVEGVVERVGIRTTRIRTFALSLVTIPNSQLTSNDPITNWTNMFHRRVRLKVALTYKTSAKQLEQITANVREYLENDDDVVPHAQAALMVDLVEFNDSSIMLDLYYYTRTTNWQEWRQIRHKHIIEVKRIVEEAGSEFAFPSRSVYVEGEKYPLEAQETS